jgi:hypothetical protein
MTTETNNAMTINMDDANLPTEGPAWEAMLEHVLANASSGDLYEAIDAEWVKFNFDIGTIYDDDEIVDYVQEAGIPIGDIYDEEEIIEAAGELQYDTINDYIWGRVKDICREENLPDHFCPVAITNELMTAIKLTKEKANLSDCVLGQQKLYDRLKAECCKLEKENEKLKKMVDGWVKSYIESQGDK